MKLADELVPACIFDLMLTERYCFGNFDFRMTERKSKPISAEDGAYSPVVLQLENIHVCGAPFKRTAQLSMRNKVFDDFVFGASRSRRV